MNVLLILCTIRQDWYFCESCGRQDYKSYIFNIEISALSLYNFDEFSRKPCLSCKKVLVSEFNCLYGVKRNNEVLQFIKHFGRYPESNTTENNIEK